MLSWTIASRLVRRISAVTAVLPILIVAAFVFATNVFFDEQSLTGAQEADSALGIYDATYTRLSMSLPPGSAVMRQVQADIEQAHLDVAVALVAPDFPLYGMADDGLYYRELNWSPNPFPRALRLKEGRFPSEPGEVALIGKGYLTSVKLGDRLSVLADADALTVVGLVDDMLFRRQGVLAAPGTWETLRTPNNVDLSQLGASPTFYFTGKRYGHELAAVVHFLAVRGEERRAGGNESEMRAAAQRALVTQAKAQQREEVPWTSRSPLSFWAPSLLLTPLVILLGFFGVVRRLGPAMRMMIRAGVPRATAVGGAWLAIMAWAVASVLVGGAVGVALGHLMAQLLAGSFGSPSPTWRYPTAATASTGIGLLIGALLGWALLVSKVRWPRQASHRGRRPRWWSSTVWRHGRHAACTVIACVVIVRLGGLRDPADGMALTWLVAVGAALITPDLVSAGVGHLPERRLTDRLTKRMLTAYPARAAATAAVIVLTVALTAGFLTSLSSALAADALTRETTALEGQIALDNDDTPSHPVPAPVVTAAETVTSLKAQTPVQMWAVGRLVRDPVHRIEELTDTVTAGTPQVLGIMFAFDSSDELATVLGRPLTGDEVNALEAGGVLIPDERIQIQSGSVELFDVDTQEPLGAVPAVRAEITPTPWFAAVPAVMLTETAKAEGLPLTPGAMIYSGVSPADAQAVLAALSQAGINPENAEIHRSLPPLIPDAALIGSAVGLSLLILLIAWSGTRSQVASMRLWASRLTQLGVKTSWARMVMWKQYLWLLAIALPVGLLAGTGPLLLLHALVPKMTVVVPWTQVSVLLISMLGSVLAACLLATRSLISSEAIGWRDEGE